MKMENIAKIGVLALLPFLLLFCALIPDTVYASPLTLRPNAAGTYTEFRSVYPEGTAHWDAVNDVTPPPPSGYIYIPCVLATEIHLICQTFQVLIQ